MEITTSRRDFLKLMAAGSMGLAAMGSRQGFAEKASSPVRKPNILLLMTDQHRPDCLGCNGNRVIKTPNFDRIAREGVSFTHAYSSTPSCTPARAGLLTGQSPWHHGMIGYGRVAEHYSIEMPRLLREAGYYTFGIGKMHWFPQRALHGFHGTLLDESGRVQSPGFTSDYRKWFKEKAPDLNPDATGIGWNEYRSAVYALPEELHPTHWTGLTAAEFIRKYDRKEPLFLKVSFARPHSPYDPPKRFMEMYQESDMPPARVGKWASRYAANAGGQNAWYGDLGVAQVRKSRRGYYGSVSFIDEQIGTILKALEEKGVLDNTLIVFTADHGDMLGDHNHWRKTFPYEPSAGIPMLVRWPKAMGMDDQRGKHLRQPVELRDVLPTLLDAAGARVPEKVDGKSMLDLVRGRTDSWRPYVDLEHDVCYTEANHWNALSDGNWKYIYSAFDGSQQLFDLRNDPHELEDLSQDPAHARTLKEWRQRMVGHLTERGEPFVVKGDLAVHPDKMIYSPHYPEKAPDL